MAWSEGVLVTQGEPACDGHCASFSVERHSLMARPQVGESRAQRAAGGVGAVPVSYSGTAVSPPSSREGAEGPALPSRPVQCPAPRQWAPPFSSGSLSWAFLAAKVTVLRTRRPLPALSQPRSSHCPSQAASRPCPLSPATRQRLLPSSEVPCVLSVSLRSGHESASAALTVAAIEPRGDSARVGSRKMPGAVSTRTRPPTAFGFSWK